MKPLYFPLIILATLAATNKSCAQSGDSINSTAKPQPAGYHQIQSK
ncbi:MAG TPA: hypothetical protein VL978_12230 [Puia sp.]|nr:hypothetical protein [Puia sp.]